MPHADSPPPPLSLSAPAVEMRQISKQFPGVIANQQVDFAVQTGEIHALLGENGAGKTTLMNILCGLYAPDAGEIYLHGKRVRFGGPAEAIASGINMVHQHFMLVERFTVAENIVLGQTRGLLRENPRQLHQRLQALAERYDLELDPTALVSQLSVGQQQRVEILKALYRQAKVLILDEPTAVLTPQEAHGLMVILKQLAAQGTAIIFISHKLNEVLALCDRVTVLRNGQSVGTKAVAGSTAQQLAEAMVGRSVDLQRPERTALDSSLQPRLKLENVTVAGNYERPALQAVSLSVRPGEILGIAGVDGNGQRELEEAIVGLRSLKSGQIQCDGRLAHIPSERYGMGLVRSFTVAENLLLRDIGQPPFTRKGWIRPQAIAHHAQALVQRYLIRTPSVSTRCGSLSGGNAQKVVVARELARQPQIILAAQPTRGLDIGAMEYVHAQLMAQRDRGVAILLISTELDELLRLSDRIAVLYEGQIVGHRDATAEASTLKQDLGLMMAGKQPSMVSGVTE